MTDKIPPHKLDRTKAVENRAKMLDVQQRARAAQPVSGGADILRGGDYNHLRRIGAGKTTL